MTDKPQAPLNLIERMAQKMAKQERSAFDSNSPGSPAADSLRAPGGEIARPAEPAPQIVRPVEPTPQFVRSAEPAPQSQAADARRSKVPSEPLLRTVDAEKSREVSLDFRVLRQNGMITPDNMGSHISNEFRGIKRKVLQRARDPETRSVVNNLIMVTSSLPGEGKTFTSLNLALSLAAERGLQVLLIDADVVRPSVGNSFKAMPREGLTDLLSGKVTRVSDVMCRCTEIPNLSVMFSGGVHAQSPELVSSARMADLCKDLSSRYPDRIIVIDTPPVLASPEPATLATYVNHLIMVVAADQTDRHQLRRSLEAVSSCKNVSLLFNKAPRWNEAEYTPYYGYANTGSAAPTSSV